MTAGLFGITSPVLFGDKQEDAIGLWEKFQMMSLAKLSSKLAGAKSANPAADDERNALIDDSLNLISAQRILQEDTESGDEIALKEDDLLRLACKKIESAPPLPERGDGRRRLLDLGRRDTGRRLHVGGRSR